MQGNSPQLRDMVTKSLEGKALAFYMEIGVRSAIAGTSEEFCLFSAESGKSHSKVVRFSDLANITEIGPSHWSLSVREGPSLSAISLTASNSDYARKLKFAMEQLATARQQACPGTSPMKGVNSVAQPDKPSETAAGAFLVLVFIPLFFGFCLWLFWPSSKGVSRSTEIGTPHTWPGYDKANHSNDCPRCGAKLDQRTDRHDCETLQRMNKAEGWIDGIYGGRRAQDL